MRLDRSERTIVVGDDDHEVRRFLEVTLRYQGYEVELAEDGDEVLDHLQSKPQVSAVLLDLFMERKNGLDTLREIRRTDQKLPVIMLSGASGPENVVEAMKAGATDFLGKPLSHDELRAVMEKALADRAPAPVPEKTAGRDRSRPASARSFFGPWSASMRELHTLAAAIGPSETPALIQGETGAGKEVLARHLHALSRRSHKP